MTNIESKCRCAANDSSTDGYHTVAEIKALIAPWEQVFGPTE